MRSPNRHPFLSWRPREREGLAIVDRRGMLKASMAGLAGLTLPRLLQAREAEPANGNRKSVILLWMAGGPSHIDTWDPKPDRPYENRGPFGVTQTRIPGVAISEPCGSSDELSAPRSSSASRPCEPGWKRPRGGSHGLLSVGPTPHVEMLSPRADGPRAGGAQGG